MSEPAELADARRRLARAEAEIETPEGLLKLQEGLELLELVAHAADAGRHREVAASLGRSYAAKVHERIRRQLDSGRNLPEHVLQHAFAVLRSFDGSSFDVPADSREAKVEIVRRLIDLYYEGYSAADKQRAYEELAKIAGLGGGT